MLIRQRTLVLLFAVLAAACTSASPGATPKETAAAPAPSGRPASVSPSTPRSAPSAPWGSNPESCASSDLPRARIAFTVSDGQANGIGIVDSDGTGFRLLVEPRDVAGQPHGGAEAPSWAGPDRVLFSSNRAGGPDDWHIFSVPVGGGDPSQITKGSDAIEYHPGISPDGRTLTYAKALATGDASEPFREAGIFVADPDGGNERQVTQAPEGGADEWPAISPDGRRIAFNRARVADGGIMIVNLDGTGLRTVVPGAMQPIRPRWSSDGTRLVFSTNADRFEQTSANVWVVDVEGSGLHQISFATGDGQAFYPAWSPDDAFLVFAHLVPGRHSTDLAVVASEGGSACTLWPAVGTGGAVDAEWEPAIPR